MSWHYAFGQHTDHEGQTYYMVEEVYDIVNSTGHTTTGMKPIGETKEELLQELSQMLDDLRGGQDVVICPPDSEFFEPNRDDEYMNQ